MKRFLNPLSKLMTAFAVILTAVVATLVVTATSVFAWAATTSASSACVDGKSVVTITFDNTEPASPANAMVVTPSIEGMALTPKTIAAPGHDTWTYTFDFDDLLPGNVTFHLEWADGHPGTDDSYSAHFGATGKCQQPPQHGTAPVINKDMVCVASKGAAVYPYSFTVSGDHGVVLVDGVAVVLDGAGKYSAVSTNVQHTIDVTWTDGGFGEAHLTDSVGPIDIDCTPKPDYLITVTDAHCVSPSAAVFSGNTSGFPDGYVKIIVGISQKSVASTTFPANGPYTLAVELGSAQTGTVTFELSVFAGEVWTVSVPTVVDFSACPVPPPTVTMIKAISTSITCTDLTVSNTGDVAAIVNIWPFGDPEYIFTLEPGTDLTISLRDGQHVLITSDGTINGPTDFVAVGCPAPVPPTRIPPPPPTPEPGLPNTGVALSGQILGGSVLLLSGGILVFMTRRRKVNIV